METFEICVLRKHSTPKRFLECNVHKEILFRAIFPVAHILLLPNSQWLNKLMAAKQYIYEQQLRDNKKTFVNGIMNNIL